MDIQKTLEERQKTHGNFESGAIISQSLKQVLASIDPYLCHRRQEACEMALHKVARICNGNPTHYDHWHDIAGYMSLLLELHDEDIEPRERLLNTVQAQSIEAIFDHMAPFPMRDSAMSIALDIFDYANTDNAKYIHEIVRKCEGVRGFCELANAI